MRSYLNLKGVILLSITLIFGLLNLTASEQTKSTAIIVANRGGSDLAEDVEVFRELLSSEITDLGYGVISEDIVLSALSQLENYGEAGGVDENLADRSSALRLGQNLGADYLLVASLLDLGKDTREVSAYNVSYTNVVYTLRASYQLIDGNTGAAITSGNTAPTKSYQQTKHSKSTSDDVTPALLASAAKSIADNLKSKSSRVDSHVVNKDSSTGIVEIKVALNDIQFPEVSVDSEGNVKLSPNKVNTVEAVAVTVEVDGIAVGTTGKNSKIEVPTGLHRISLTRSDLKTWERMVNLRDGMTLNVTMELTEKAKNDWLENTVLLDKLKRDAALTDGEVKVLEGTAQMLEQSGYKVDTDEAPTINKTQTLMNSN